MSDPLVLLPGFVADVRVWGAQIEALSADHPLYLPRYGAAASIEAMAEAALQGAPDRFALAGHGMGGMVAAEIQRRAPERVSRLALLCTNCLAETPPGAAQRDLRIARAKAGRLNDVLAEELPDECFAAGEYRVMIGEFARQMAKDLGAETYLRHATALQRRPDQQRTLRGVKVPTLVLCGAADTLYLPRRHEFMAGLVPRARLVVVEGAGHLPMVERPDTVTEALKSWLSDGVPSRLLG
jgi:pimeloyl-ACP methyl ester carboxylesterase